MNKEDVFRFYLLGERAAVAESLRPVDLACQRRIWWMAGELRRSGRYLDVVPGMNNLTVVYDPRQDEGCSVLESMGKLWKRADESRFESRQVSIPVAYGGEAGPDLDWVAHHAGLSRQEVIARHSGAEYIVYFLGFQPGFPYLGGLPRELATPRLPEPRPHVPAGSVGIGGEQTGVYPTASPGGWQLIGKTRLALFDPARVPPALLVPGDRVRFVPESP